MFYRRKIIFSLFDALQGQIQSSEFHLFLFLLCIEQEKPDHEFVPLSSGPYSYSAQADIQAMLKKGVLTEEKKKYIKKDNTDYRTTLKEKDQDLLQKAIQIIQQNKGKELKKHLFKTYPFYAIHSEEAKELLTKKEYEKVKEALPKNTKTTLYTIGYEGISLEYYLQQLIQNDIRVLIDVRGNPVSRKFGFSKSLLEGYLKDLKIDYLHLPELGIATDQRTDVKTDADFEKLFEKYKRTILQTETAAQKTIIDLIKKEKRVALTCFEADPSHCHRSYLADSIRHMKGFEWQVVNL